jgi:hypothetical protein
MILLSLIVAKVKIYTFLYCNLKDFVIFPFQILTAMSNTVKIIGILDFADDTSCNFKNIKDNLIKKYKFKNKYHNIENSTTTNFLISYYTKHFVLH